MDSSADWITIVSAVIMAAATVALVRYAHVTIEEGKKDRRKDMIERQLEKVYSPLYEILRRAKFENGDRSKARQVLRVDWVAHLDEYTRMREIVVVFGHYFENQKELELFAKALENPRTEPEPFGKWRGFEETVMWARFKHIMDKRERLFQDLVELTRS